MKIFWSWQSDTPGKTGRHFVRGALDEAINQLKSELTVDDCERPDELHVDQDTQGTAGSPPLVETILRKIDEAAVFIADVTPVTKNADGKFFINPNVAIEYGYALKSRGDRRILMILNTFHGAIEQTPFDLRHKSGFIRFNLAETADKLQIAEERASLVGLLKSKIRLILSTVQGEKAATTPKFQRREPAQGIGMPVLRGVPLGVGDTRRTDVRLANGCIGFIRVSPTSEIQPVKRVQARKLLREQHLYPLGYEMSRHGDYGSSDDAEFGFWTKDESLSTATCFTMFFLSGELWSVATGLDWAPADYPASLAPGPLEKDFSSRLLKNSVLVAARCVWTT